MVKKAVLSFHLKTAQESGTVLDISMEDSQGMSTYYAFIFGNKFGKSQ